MSLDEQVNLTKEPTKQQQQSSDSEEYFGRRKKRILKSEVSEEDIEMADELEVANQKMEISDDSPQTNQPDAEMIHTEDTRVETERKVAAPGKKLVKV